MGLVEEQLPDLLGDALLKPSGSDYGQERRTVAKIRDGLTRSEAVALVGYAHGLQDGTDAIRDRIVAAGQASMDDWNDGDLLRRRFAACAALQLLENHRSGVSVAAALSTAAARLTALAPAVPQLPQAGTDALVRLSDWSRTVSFADPPSVQPFPTHAKASELPPESDEGVTSTSLRRYVQAHRKSVRTAASATRTRILRLEKLAQRNSEEVDLLWWTLTPQSRYLSSWSDSSETATLVAAIEVGRRLLLDPPPRGTDRVLADALIKARVAPEEPVSLNSAVQSLPTGAMTDPSLSGRVTPWAMPVLSGVRARREQLEGPPVVDGGLTASRARWALQLVNDLSLSRVLA